MNEIRLARAGQVNWRTHARLGYDRLARGVYGHAPVVPGLDPWTARRAQFFAHVRAMVSVYRTGAVLYGTTALQVMGVALPSRLEDWENCHLLVRADAYRPRRIGVITHTTATMPPLWNRPTGWPLLHPVDHWLQVGGTQDELVEVGDGLLRRQRPLLTLDEFHSRLSELGGTTGVRAARHAAQWVRPGTDSLYETRLRLILAHAGLPVPVVNAPVPCPNAGRVYHADLGYPWERLGIEYDGADHVGSRAQMAIDAERRRQLQDAGWLIITATVQDLDNPAQFVRSVEQALILRRGAHGLMIGKSGDVSTHIGDHQPG